MTKYEELYIGHLGDGPVLDMLQVGDIVTIKGPGERDLLVREVVMIEPEGKPVIAGLISPASSLYALMVDRSREIVRVERPVPEVELPTEPGYYESARYPLRGGYFALRLNPYGEWYRDGVRKTEEQMREHMPLTRLVPETEAAPTKLADRLDVYKLADVMKREYHGSSECWNEDAAAVIAAIDNGELDK